MDGDCPYPPQILDHWKFKPFLYVYIIIIMHLNVLQLDLTSTFSACFLFFFFFCLRVLGQFFTVHLLLWLLFINSNSNIWLSFFSSVRCVLFTDLQILFFSYFYIKNGSHGIIYTFKNYFATVFFNFQFQFSIFNF